MSITWTEEMGAGISPESLRRWELGAGREPEEFALPWREEEEARVRCDTCLEECLLEEATICPRADCVTCPRCVEAETLAGEEVLGGILR